MDVCGDGTNFSDDELQFHQFIRQNIICLLLFIILYLISFAILRLAKGQSDNDELYAGNEDYFVFRISLWLCTFSLSVSFAAAMLLPFSIISSEIIINYSDSCYFQWLNWQLIDSLWSYVFAMSNLSLFVLLPFAYFFIESQGFKCHGKGILPRIYEATAVCILLTIVLLCLADIFHTMLISEVGSFQDSLLNFTHVNLRYIYSCGSLFGVVTLLITTPMGFARLFTIVSSHLMAKKKAFRMQESVDDYCARLEYNTFLRRVLRDPCTKLVIDPLTTSSTIDTTSIGKLSLRGYRRILLSIYDPLAILFLLFLTSLSLLMVILNIIGTLFGFRFVSKTAREFKSGHYFGTYGATLEIMVIWYHMAASLVGIYSMPFLNRMRPKIHKTSMTSIIANCMTVLIISSALPVLSKTLGTTTFDLVGAYGTFHWLSNFSLVWTYNVIFAIATVVSVINHVTAPVRHEVRRRLFYITFGLESDYDKAD